MVRGRPISAADVAGSEPVVVITESMAQAFWPTAIRSVSVCSH